MNGTATILYGRLRDAEHHVAHLDDENQTLANALADARVYAEEARREIGRLRERARDCRILPDETLPDALSRIEAVLLDQSLKQHGGRRSATARRLGITREGLYKKMKRLGVWRAPAADPSTREEPLP